MKKKAKKKFQHHHKQILILAATIVVLCAAVTYVIFRPAEPGGPKHLVTFYDHGKQHVVLTHAATVRDAIKASDLVVNPQDVTEPSRDSKLTSSSENVIIYRSRLVGIADGSIRQSVVTVAQSPNAVLEAAKLSSLGPKDKATFSRGDVSKDNSSIVLTIERAPVEQQPKQPARVAFTPRADALTVSKGAQIFVDSQGVAHRETYYDLPMNRVVRACGGSYTIRSDGAKIDQDGYVLVAANLSSYPRCSVVETSLGPGKVYDTGGFARVHPYGFDLATDWTNYNGQ